MRRSWDRSPVAVSQVIVLGSLAAYLLMPLAADGSRSDGGDLYRRSTLAILLLHGLFLAATCTRWFPQRMLTLNRALLLAVGTHLLFLILDTDAATTPVVGALMFTVVVSLTWRYNLGSPTRVVLFIGFMLIGCVAVDIALGGTNPAAHVLVAAVGGIGVAATLASSATAPSAGAPAPLTAPPEPALTDTLTALPRRSAFTRELAGMLANTGDEAPAALMLVDLDRFGRINDALGHRDGDRALAAAAFAIQRSVRPSDLLARVGGDEFGVMLGGASTRADVLAVADRIQSTLAEGLTVGGNQVFCSASIGAAIRRPGATAEVLFDEAHGALLRAKRGGPGARFVSHAGTTGRAIEESRLEQELWAALEGDQLVLHYQPKLSAGDLRIVGFEALVRWQHPTRGLLGPERFVDLAEATGLIVPMGRYVLGQALRDIAVLRRAFDRRLSVAVNLSARELGVRELAESVATALAEAEVGGDALQLEITESALLAQGDVAGVALSAIRELGVRVEVDDFGTGYSSLSRLDDLPVDAIKVDRSMVAKGPRDARILDAVSGLARALGLEVVAEGVETAEELDVVRRLGCDTLQGWLFARAMPVDEVRELLQRLDGAPMQPTARGA